MKGFVRREYELYGKPLRGELRENPAGSGRSDEIESLPHKSVV